MAKVERLDTEPWSVVRRQPVKWLSVTQLGKTLIDVLLATTFARFADRREAMAGSPREVYSLGPGQLRDASAGEVWVDFLADTGDGFSSTFAMARCLTGGARVLEGAPGRRGDPPQPSAIPVWPDGDPWAADLLILGGDEVYPVASPKAYEERFTGVFRAAAAFDGLHDHPPVLALPGNHDWYDGLAGFRRLFCESRLNRLITTTTLDGLTEVPEVKQCDDVGGWRAFQSRSYFAIKLTSRWWLWATDNQLDAPLDVEQMAYFGEVARGLAPEDRIILCTSTPSWLEAQGTNISEAPHDSPLFNLLWFIDRVLGKERWGQLRLILTGDEHHYSRYTPTLAPPSDDAGTQGFRPELVTCGGGGAYLASTHHLTPAIRFDLRPWWRAGEHSDVSSGDSYSSTYSLVEDETYPSRRKSRQLGVFVMPAAVWRNGFGLPALLALATLPLMLAIGSHLKENWWAAWQVYVALLPVVGLLGLYAWSGTAGRRYTSQGGFRRAGRWIRTLLLTTLHAGAQLGGVLIGAIIVEGLGAQWTANVPTWAFLCALPLSMLLCMVVFVAYLCVADQLCCHTTEAFSAMHIEDYKSLLRLRVTEDAVEVFVIVVDRVPKARTIHTALLPDTRPQPGLHTRFRVLAEPTSER